jgi:hypothetical protein
MAKSSENPLHGVEWVVAIDDAWRTPRLRRAFERDCGFAPLVAGELAEGRNCRADVAARYRDAFALWVTREQGLEIFAPSDVKARLDS